MLCFKGNYKQKRYAFISLFEYRRNFSNILQLDALSKVTWLFIKIKTYGYACLLRISKYHEGHVNSKLLQISL